MKVLILFLLAATTSITCLGQKSLDELLNLYNTRSVPYISVEELRMQQVNHSPIILDSRERVEYEISHIPSSIYVGYNHFSSSEISEKIPDKNTPIIVYCSLGIRSEEVGEKLKKVGYTNVQNLYGGIFEWKNKEYPLTNLLKQSTDSVHTFSKEWSKWLDKGVKVY